MIGDTGRFEAHEFTAPNTNREEESEKTEYDRWLEALPTYQIGDTVFVNRHGVVKKNWRITNIDYANRQYHVAPNERTEDLGQIIPFETLDNTQLSYENPLATHCRYTLEEMVNVLRSDGTVDFNTWRITDVKNGDNAEYTVRNDKINAEKILAKAELEKMQHYRPGR